MQVLLEPRNKEQVFDRHWTDWFVGFERPRHCSVSRADEFMPDLLKQAQRLKKGLAYVDCCMACW
jgi:hypothetical protein